MVETSTQHLVLRPGRADNNYRICRICRAYLLRSLKYRKRPGADDGSRKCRTGSQGAGSLPSFTRIIATSMAASTIQPIRYQRSGLECRRRHQARLWPLIRLRATPIPWAAARAGLSWPSKWKSPVSIGSMRPIPRNPVPRLSWQSGKGIGRHFLFGIRSRSAPLRLNRDCGHHHLPNLHQKKKGPFVAKRRRETDPGRTISLSHPEIFS